MDYRIRQCKNCKQDFIPKSKRHTVCPECWKKLEAYWRKDK